MKNNQVLNFPNSLMNKKAMRYAVILAGGDGSRLKHLTRAISGDERPKQFCSILNNETLLDASFSEKRRFDFIERDRRR